MVYFGYERINPQYRSEPTYPLPTNPPLLCVRRKLKLSVDMRYHRRRRIFCCFFFSMQTGISVPRCYTSSSQYEARGSAITSSCCNCVLVSSVKSSLNTAPKRSIFKSNNKKTFSGEGLAPCPFPLTHLLSAPWASRRLTCPGAVLALARWGNGGSTIPAGGHNMQLN